MLSAPRSRPRFRHIEVNSLIATAAVEWQVIDFTGASVQTGTASLTPALTSVTSALTTVDPARTWLVYSYSSDNGTATDVGQKLVRGRVTSPAELTFDRYHSGQQISIRWYAIEFTDGSTVQSGSEPFDTTETQRNVTLSSVSAANTFVVGGYAQRGGRSSYSADDNIGVGWMSLALTSATNLRITRAVTGASTADIGWFAVSFALAPTPTPTLTTTPTAAATSTPTVTATGPPTTTPTATPTATPTVTPTPTTTQMPTVSPTLTNPATTPTPTETEGPTPTTSPTATPSQTASATPTDSATPTATATATPSATSTPTSTATATPAASPTPSSTPPAPPTATPTPSVEVCDNCLDDDANGLTDRDDDGQCSAPADGNGAGVAAGKRRAVVRCGTALRKIGGRFAFIHLSRLQRCTDALLGCALRKPGITRCLVKARALCDRNLAASARRAAAAAPALAKACGSPRLPFDDVLAASGLGYSGELERCAARGVPGLGTLADVAACVTRQHACAAERLLAFQYPRAFELIQSAGIDTAALPCLDRLVDGFGAGRGPALGVALLKCQKAVRQAGTTLFRKRSAAVQRCIGAAFACVQLNPGSTTCPIRTAATCARAVAEIAALAGKTQGILATACGPTALDLTNVLASEGLGFTGLADACAARGVPALASVDDIATCLRAQHACQTDQLLENESPRLRELLGLGAVTLP